MWWNNLRFHASPGRHRANAVFQTAPYPDPPYSNRFLDNFTLTEAESHADLNHDARPKTLILEIAFIAKSIRAFNPLESRNPHRGLVTYTMNKLRVPARQLDSEPGSSSPVV